MIIRLFIFMCLFFTLASNSYANDPFALLFGDEVIDASSDRKPGADDLILLRFNIRSYLVEDSWSAFETARGLCLPVKPFTDALEFPLTYSETGISGWITDPEATFSLRFDDEASFIKTKLGWCTDMTTLERLFPVKLVYQSSNLTLQAEPTIMLPMDARLERLAARQALGAAQSPKGPDYKPVDNPYKWLSAPIIDARFGLSTASGQKTQSQASFDIAADLLKMSARLRMASRQDKLLDSARFTVYRESYLGDQLGPLKARKFALGDVATNAQPLLGRSRSGRGIIISNQPLFQPDQFDQTTLRGPLPAGWEAELYNDDILLDFITAPDANGDYVFEEVALHPGFNRLTVKLFGPHGETEERVISQFVGSELCAANSLKYAAGYISPDTALFDEWLVDDLGEEKTSLIDMQDAAEAPYMFVNAAYGLSTRYALRLDLRASASSPSLGVSLIGSQFGGYGVLRLASDGHGRPALQAQFQRRLSGTASLSINGVDYGGLQTDLSGYGENAAARKLDMRLDNQIKIGGALLPLQTELAWLTRADGRQTLWASNRMSGQIENLRWSNTLRYTHSAGEAGQMQGEFLTSRRMGRGRARAALTYGYDHALALKTASLAYQQKLGRDSFLQTGLSYDMTSNVAAMDMALSHQFRTAAVSVKSGLNSQGDWSLGLGLSLSLFHNKHRQKIQLAPPGLSRSGVIAPRLFDDRNNNGRFDAGDTPMSGGQYITDNSLRTETGDDNGLTLLPDLPTAKPLTNELKLSSVADPFLYPAEIGRSMTLRSGQVLSYDVPLTAIGEAEGYLFFVKSNIKTAVSGVTVEALNAAGHIVGTAMSEYDGYFYFDKLPAVDLTLRARPAAVQSVSGSHKPVDIKLSRSEPTALGLELVINDI